MATEIEKAPEALQQIVADADTGGRKPTGFTAKLIFAVALAWALFQLWYASPLPFTFGFAILNDTEARSLHLAFAMFLAFLAWPAFKRSPRKHVPVVDWILALAGAFAAAYLLLFYANSPRVPASRRLRTSSSRPSDSCCCSKPRAAPSAGRWPCSRLLFIALLDVRPVPARGAAAQGRVAQPPAVAHVADDRGRVRHRARRVDRHDLRLRAVRHAARPRRRRQLHDAGLLRDARPPARRPGEGRGRLVGARTASSPARRSPTWCRAASSRSR